MERLKKEQDINYSNEKIEDAVKTIIACIGKQYYALYYIWLKSETYVCFEEKIKGKLSLIGEKGDYTSTWEAYIQANIDRSAQEELRQFGNITTLADRIGNKNSISYDYYRKGIGWTRGQFIAGKRDENGTPLTVLYTVADINEEMEMKKKREEAEQEALHDSLTKLWNRKAFEQFKEAKEFKEKPAGLLLFDIDRFKGINDQFGHDVGDQVIIAIVDEARSILRKKDRLFRLGGDEFAILIYNCNTSIWKTVCKKMEIIHTDIKESMPQKMDVTISGGLCMNKNGYSDDIYKLADQALYNTKANGRGGCTMINSKGEIVKEWHDNRAFLRSGDVYEKNSIVTWRLDKPKKDGLQYRVYGDKLFNKFVGLDSNASPEQVYQAWLKRVEPDNLDIIREASKIAFSAGKVEVVFLWNHPEKGVIQLRCSATYESETDDFHTFIGYIHIITGTHVVTMEDISDKVKNALEEMLLCNFYIRLSDYSFKVYKAPPYMKELLGNNENMMNAIHAYTEYMVVDENKHAMNDFLDLNTLKERLKEDKIISINYTDPNIGSAKARFIVVDRDENGDAETVSLVVEMNE